MAVSLIQTNSGHGGNYVNSYTLAFSSAVAAGNFLVAVIGCGAADTPSLSDNVNGAWALAATITGASSGRKTQIWYREDADAGSTTITVQFGGGQFSDSFLVIREYEGVVVSDALGEVATGDAGTWTNTHTSGNTDTTTSADKLLVAGLCVDANPSQGTNRWAGSSDANFGNDVVQGAFDNWTGGMMADRVVEATGQYAVTFTLTDVDSNGQFRNGQTVLATFAAAAAGGTAFEKDLSEIVGVTDTLSKETIKAFAEAIAFVDTTARELTALRVFTEIVAITDTVKRQIERAMSELLAITDTVTKQFIKVCAEFVGVVDTRSVSFVAEKALAEIVGLVDSVKKQGQRLLSELVGVVDAVSVKVTGRKLSETVGVVDVLTRSALLAFAELLGVVDKVARQSMKRLVEIFGIADAVATSNAFFREFAEAFGIVDKRTSTAGKAAKETVGIVDTRAMVGTFERALSEVVGIVDSVKTQAERLLSEAIGIVDVFSATLAKQFAEAMGIVDRVSRETERAFSEIIAVADSAAKQALRTLSEAVGVADALVRQVGRVLSEAVGVADSVLRQYTGFRSFSEVLEVRDAITRQIERVLAEAVGVVDRMVKQPVKRLVEKVGIADAVEQFFLLARVLVEAVGVKDTRETTLGKQFVEILGIVDAVEAAKKIFRKGVAVLLSTADKSVVALRSGISTLRTASKRAAVLKSKQGTTPLKSKDDRSVL